MKKVISLLALILLAFNVFAVDTATASPVSEFDIVAYRVGGTGSSPELHVVDALSHSLEHQVGENDTIPTDITSYLDDYLGSTPENILLSFRVEGSALGSFYVTASVSHFYLVTNNGTTENPNYVVSSPSYAIKGKYAFGNMDIRFNGTESLYDQRDTGSATAYISQYGYDSVIKDTISEISSITPTTTTENNNKVAVKSDNYSSAWWTVSGLSGARTAARPWICRGALWLSINQDDYNAVSNPNGTYRTQVKIELGAL